ncbi:MAG: glycosyltransferase family 2 protein [Hyphomicrobiaceae bacterium]
MNPEVSVIIPVYNRERTIARAICSVLKQSYQNFEIIVVDDASVDSTIAVVEGLHCDRITVLQHDHNRGTAAARNSAICLARGDYIAFLDSDDEWFPGKLEAQIAALHTPSIGTDVCCTGVVLHLADRGIWRGHLLTAPTDWQRQLALGCGERPGSTLLGKRDVFESVGLFDESLRRFEDWDWMLRFASFGGRVLVLPGPLAHVYNTRARHGEQTERSAIRFLKKHRQKFDALDPSDRRQSLCDLWMQIATTYALEGRLIDAARLSLRGLGQRPIHATRRLAGHAKDYVALRRRE